MLFYFPLIIYYEIDLIRSNSDLFPESYSKHDEKYYLMKNIIELGNFTFYTENNYILVLMNSIKNKLFFQFIENNEICLGKLILNDIVLMYIRLISRPITTDTMTPFWMPNEINIGLFIIPNQPQ